MSQNSDSKKIFILLVSVLALILVFFVIFVSNLLINKNSNSSPYSAVYLKTGDIYFGKLSWFPRVKIENPWFLQRTVDEKNETRIGVAPLADAFWKPVNEIFLNRSEIVFWTRLQSDSQVIPLLSGENKSSP